MQRGSLGLSGGLKLRDEAAKLFVRLVKANAWEKGLRARLSHESLWGALACAFPLSAETHLE